jgi:cell division septation protein DedD
MRGYFNEDGEEPKAEQPGRDRELTLGAGAVFGLFSALALLCGLCFGVGYAVGHRASASSAAANAPTPAPDQEPLQGSSSIPKPSAAETSPAPQTDGSSTTPEAGTPATGEGANPPTTGQGPAESGQAPGVATPGQADVGPALQGAGNTPQTAPLGPNVHAALPSQAQLMVQIAAVANAEVADVLETALRKRGYAVAGQRDPADGLIHVRIGPFTSREEAIRWRDKLLDDGYNAVVQP